GVGILLIDQSPMIGAHHGNLEEFASRTAFGPVYSTGSLVSYNGSRNLEVGSGEYFYGSSQFDPSGAAIGFTFTTVYRSANGPFGFTYGSATVVDNAQYNDLGTNTLQPIPVGEYAKHSFYINGEGANEKYFFVYA